MTATWTVIVAIVSVVFVYVSVGALVAPDPVFSMARRLRPGVVPAFAADGPAGRPSMPLVSSPRLDAMPPRWAAPAPIERLAR